MMCSGCGAQMHAGSRFCSNCGRAAGMPLYPARTRLVRPRHGRVLGGVCAGFAQEYGWDVVLVRILLVAFVIFGCGAPIIAYLIAWIVMPNEPFFFPMQTYAPPPAAAGPPQGPPGTQPAA